MQLKPLEETGSFLGWFMNKAMTKAFGKPLLSTQISHSRLPALWWGLLAFTRIEGSFTLPKGLGLLIHVRASMKNHCSYCQDISRAFAVQQKMGLEKFNALWNWQDSNLFNEPERAALAYIDAINDRDDGAMSEGFHTLKSHFNERQIVEITTQNAIANFHNLINVPLGLEADGLEDMAQQRLAS